MKVSISKVVGIALLVGAMGAGVWAPAAAQEASCGAGQTIMGTHGTLIVDANGGTCTVRNAVITEGIEVVSGTLRIEKSTIPTVVFGDIAAGPGTSIEAGVGGTTTGAGPVVVGKIVANQVTRLTVTDSKVGDGIESKQGGTLSLTGSTLGGIKSELDGSVTASNNLLGDKVEVKEAAMTVTLSGNIGGEVIVEKSARVSVTSNTAFSTIKIVGNTPGPTTVNGNVTPTLECSSNAGLTRSGNIVLEDKCTN